MISLRRYLPFARRLRTNQNAIVLVEFALVLPFLLVLFLGVYTVCDMYSCLRKMELAAHELTDMSTRVTSVKTTDVQLMLQATEQVLAPYDYKKATIRLSQLQMFTFDKNCHEEFFVRWSQQLTNGDTSTYQSAYTSGSSWGYPTTHILLEGGQEFLIPQSWLPQDMIAAGQGQTCQLMQTAGALSPNKYKGAGAGDCNSPDAESTSVVCLMMGEVIYQYPVMGFLGFGSSGSIPIEEKFLMYPRNSVSVPETG